MSSAIRRLQKDYLEYQANREEFTLISAQPLENNLFEWHVNICAPDGPYANLPLHFIMEFPKNYPNSPPDVKLCTIINHPNVFKNWGESGAWICLDLLKDYTTSTKYEGWSSVYTVTSILLQMQSFLFSENVPQDYGGNSSLEYGNSSVVTSLNRIKSFKCKCGHHWKTPSPALPKAFNKLLCTEVSHTGSRLLAQEGAVINQDTVFWQKFPEWKIAAYDCGSLCKTRGNKLMYECKIDWGWNGFYQEDIRIGWGVINSRNPLKHKV
jgi:ubiquitin-protein ligase